MKDFVQDSVKKALRICLSSANKSLIEKISAENEIKEIFERIRCVFENNNLNTYHPSYRYYVVMRRSIESDRDVCVLCAHDTIRPAIEDAIRDAEKNGGFDRKALAKQLEDDEWLNEEWCIYNDKYDYQIMLCYDNPYPKSVLDGFEHC